MIIPFELSRGVLLYLNETDLKPDSFVTSSSLMFTYGFTMKIFPKMLPVRESACAYSELP